MVETISIKVTVLQKFTCSFPLSQGAIVYSNIVTTVSPTYAQEVCTAEVIILALLPDFAIVPG